MTELKWAGETCVQQLVGFQRSLAGGVTPVVRTMVAAYVQHKDVETLLYLLTTYKVKLNEHDAPLAEQIRARHVKYASEK